MYDSIVIGCGFAGTTIARELAEKGKNILILEQRDHIGGNAFDTFDDNGILVHQYGPHIFHTNEEHVYKYLSRFTEWYDYSHEVVGNIHGDLLPIPFNLNTLELVYGEEKGNILKNELIQAYGMETKVPILELMKNDSDDIRAIAMYVYENIFLKYTMKQWGQKPEEIDSSVSGRVPIYISYDNRYFQDRYQGMPLNGYTSLFERMLDHNNISVELNTTAASRLTIDPDVYETVLLDGKPFYGEVIYTGPIDELFECRFGRLPYRSLNFVFEHFNQDYYQSHGVVNYTVSEEFTRITEFKYLTGQKLPGSTTIIKEFPISYSGKLGEIPYYAIINEENQKLYDRYKELLSRIPKFYLLGRLAEYKYYNMDAIVDRALSLASNL